jgi:hypothetical protein
MLRGAIRQEELVGCSKGWDLFCGGSGEKGRSLAALGMTNLFWAVAWGFVGGTQDAGLKARRYKGKKAQDDNVFFLWGWLDRRGISHFADFVRNDGLLVRSL